MKTALATLIAVCCAFGSSSPGPRMVRIPVRLPADAAPLDAKSLQVDIDGNRARVARVLTPADPQMILVVLDLVGDLGAIEPAKEALISAIGKLPPSTYVGLLRAQDGLTVLTDPAQDRTPAIDAIRNLSISGRPGLLETLEPVERLADSIARKSQVRVSVLFVTDSNVAEYREDFTNPIINSSDPHDLSRKFPETLIQEKMSKLQGVFSSHETPIHIVHLANRTDRLNEAYQNGLRQLTELMVGSAEFCRSYAEIPEAVDSAIAVITAEYSLLIAVPENAPSNLQFQISAGGAPIAYRGRLKLKEK